MRIIAGERRGHHIEGPAGSELRPTSDRVREAIFNILRDEVEDRIVLDLFAGTGALGLEALSRGAERATFVERDRQHTALIRKNLSTLRYEDRCQVVTADAYRWIRAYEAIDPRPVVAFLDPPYNDFKRNPARVRAMVETLVQRLPGDSVILVESGQALGEAELGETAPWSQRRYGSTCVAIRTLNSSQPETVHEPSPTTDF